MPIDSEQIVKATTSMETNIENNEKMYLFMLFLIGMINNTGYVMVGTAAQDIAKKFDMDNFMSLFQLSLIVLSGVMRSINSKFFIKIAHKKRILVAIVLSICAFVIIAVSSSASAVWGFYTCLLGSVLCGAMQAFGESVMLGYIKVFPPRLVAGWSSGTGFAGPFGSGLLLVLKAVDLDLYIIFLVMIPIQASYWLCFLWYDRRKTMYYQVPSSEDGQDSALSEPNNGDEVSLCKRQIFLEAESDFASNKKLSMENIRHVMPKMWTLALNLGSVYFLEYVTETGWAERAHPKKDDSDYPSGFVGFLDKNGFVILCFCYQIGVFISRSSLYLVKIKRVIFFTLIQMCNFGLWIFFAISKSVPMYVQIPCMIFVGLMGGGSYVNVNYLLLNHETIHPTEKELAMNICSIFNDTGVLLSSLFVLLVDNVMITND